MSSTGAVLGDVAEFVRGINFKPEDVVSPTTLGAVACLRTKNVQAELDCVDVWGVDERFVKRADQIVSAGDILVSSANSWNLVGKCCWISELPWKTTFGGFVSVLRADRQRMDPGYLYRWFSSDRTQATVRSFGQQTTNISNLNTARCLTLPLKLPTLPDQKRIAALLDRADALRAKRRATLALLDGLSSAVFLEMFGEAGTTKPSWPSGELASLIVDGPQNGLYRPSSDYGRGVPILRIDGFYDGAVVDMAALKRVDISPSQRRPFELAEGDIVINRVNSIEYLGKCALIPKLIEPTVFESNMMRFRVDLSVIHPRFLVQVLQTWELKSQILGRAKRAVNQASINQQDVGSFRVPLPPLSLQREFVTRVAAIERLSSAAKRSALALDSLFASLQHQAFNGEL